MKTNKFVVLVFFLLFILPNAYSQKQDGYYQKTKEFIIKLPELSADILKNGNVELYLPVKTIHDRWFNTYSNEQIKNYQENPYGYGFGKSLRNNKNNIDGLLFIKFQDSHNDSEYGVFFQHQWLAHYVDNKIEPFVGYVAGLSFRVDYLNYTPIPVAFPTVGIIFQQHLSAECAILPFFNVLFFWIKYRF